MQPNVKTSIPTRFMKPTYWIILAITLIAYAIFAYLTLKVTRKSAIVELQNQGISIANTQANELKSELQKFLLVPIILKENPDVTDALMSMSHFSIEGLNKKLLSLTEQTNATYIYVIDKTGRTIASSNYLEKDSFVGRDYQYRPYFLQAMEQGQSQYYAKGQTTGRPGLFLGGRISYNDQSIGVIVVKVEFSNISSRWNDPVSTSFVVNNDGIILFSGDTELNFSTIEKLSDEKQAEILEARQFGLEPLSPSNLDLTALPYPLDKRRQKTVMSQVEISELDWRLIRTNPIKLAISDANNRAQLTILLVGGSLLTFMLLWRRRIVKEIEKTKLTNLLKSEVTKRTRELSETNEKLQYEIEAREKVNIRFRATFAENGVKFLKRGNTAQTSNNLESIVSLTDRIGSISTELRRYARRGSHAITSVDIKDVFDGITLLMGEQLRAAGIQRDALQNHPDPIVKINTKSTSDSVEIIIADNGPGIDPSILKDIFTPFVTTKPHGMGMGLGIAKDIMTDFEGTIEPISTQLGGAAFLLRLKRND